MKLIKVELHKKDLEKIIYVKVDKKRTAKIAIYVHIDSEYNEFTEDLVLTNRADFTDEEQAELLDIARDETV